MRYAVRQPPRNTEAELDALEACCQRLAGFCQGLDLEWVDGFLTAVAAAPRRPATDEWLGALAGDDFARCFADPPDHAQAVASLEARLAVLRRQLDAEALYDEPNRLRLAPLLLEAVPGEVEAGAVWAHGFLAAVETFAQDWPPPDDDTDDGRQAINALAAITALTLDPEPLAADLARRRAGWAPTRDELIDDACWAVQDLRCHAIDHAPRPATIRLAPQPGRNDPCPCGSGRKFKKCCGQA
jgi:uncharacterized protein